MRSFRVKNMSILNSLENLFEKLRPQIDENFKNGRRTKKSKKKNIQNVRR